MTAGYDHRGSQGDQEHQQVVFFLKPFPVDEISVRQQHSCKTRGNHHTDEIRRVSIHGHERSDASRGRVHCRPERNKSQAQSCRSYHRGKGMVTAKSDQQHDHDG